MRDGKRRLFEVGSFARARALICALVCSGSGACGQWMYDPLDPILGAPSPWSELPAGDWMLVEPRPSLRYPAYPRDPARTDAQGEGDRVPFTSPPRRGYTSPVYGEGRIYYFGGTDYSGNDVDVYDPASNAWWQSYRPNVPPAGDPFYGSGGSGQGWIDPATGELRPYAVSGYGRTSYCPVTGSYLVTAAFCRSAQLDSGGAWTCAVHGFAILAYRNGVWTPRVFIDAANGSAALSDYDFDLGGVLLLRPDPAAGNLDVQVIRPDGSRLARSRVLAGLARSGGAGSLYVPPIHAHLFASFGEGAGALVRYDAVTEIVEDVTPSAPAELRARFDAADFAMAWDPRSERVIGVSVERADGAPANENELGRPRIWELDPRTMLWFDRGIAATAPLVRGIGAGWGREPLMFDASDGVALFFQGGPDAQPTLWAYRPLR